jgi:hypothetical protein
VAWLPPSEMVLLLRFVASDLVAVRCGGAVDVSVRCCPLAVRT